MSPLRPTLAVIGVLATAIALSACSATTTMGGMNHSTSSSPSPVENRGAFNDSDVELAMDMIPHHEQAIEMSDMILGKAGIDQKVVDLATRIKAAQAPEITEMTAWLKAWGRPMGSMSGMSGMDSGMMSDDDMAALAAAGGTDASKLFLTQMMTHHQGAITMAKTEISEGENADAIGLARAIITGQSAEIVEMADMLSALR
ncbi:DUF305 domain-containing protein [Lacisediminihabitans sp.]|uniref:DUF305 domain-containing protein n=1 Tax=Lacisediminihabitans sp. TaxID=2787631 RepID=UPI00374DB5B0